MMPITIPTRIANAGIITFSSYFGLSLLLLTDSISLLSLSLILLLSLI